MSSNKKLSISASSSSSTSPQSSFSWSASNKKNSNLFSKQHFTSKQNGGLVKDLRKKFSPSSSPQQHQLLASHLEDVEMNEQQQQQKFQQLKKCQSVCNLVNQTQLVMSNVAFSSTNELASSTNENDFENLDIREKIKKFDRQRKEAKVTSAAAKNIVKKAAIAFTSSEEVNKSNRNEENAAVSSSSGSNSNLNDSMNTSLSEAKMDNFNSSVSLKLTAETNSKSSGQEDQTADDEASQEDESSSSIDGGYRLAATAAEGFNSVKFEKSYSEIKRIFSDLRSENELIESLLGNVLAKVREATLSFGEYTKSVQQQQQCTWVFKSFDNICEFVRVNSERGTF